MTSQRRRILYLVAGLIAVAALVRLRQRDTGVAVGSAVSRDAGGHKEPPPTSRLVGALAGVVRAPSGEPVGSATLVASRLDRRQLPRQAQSDESGRFAFPQLPLGWYAVTANARSGYAVKTDIVVEPSRAADVVLVLRASGYRLTGHVLDAGGGVVSRATVQAQEAGGSYETISDDGGAFSLFLHPGRYALSATAEGYGAARPKPVVLFEAREVDVSVNAMAFIRGKVLDPSGALVAGARVALVSGSFGPTVSTVASDSGVFSFEGVTAGPYSLIARKGDLVGDLAVIAAPGENQDVTLRTSVGASLSGRVTDLRGAPVSTALVTIPFADDTTATATTDGDGRYRLSGLKQGEYRVEAAAVGQGRAVATVNIEAAHEQDFQLKALVTVTVVVTQRDGSALAGALVTMRRPEDREDQNIASDASGRASFTTATGKISVTATADDCGQTQSSLDLTADATTTLRCADSGSISGVVKWDDGAVAEGVAVTVGGASILRPFRATTDDRGAFTLEHLGAGAQSVVATTGMSLFIVGGSDLPCCKTVTLATAEQRRGLELVVARETHHIDGMVAGPNGPLVDVQITAQSERPVPFENLLRDPIFTGPDGRFSVRDLAAGRYKLTARSKAYGELFVTSEADGAPVRIEFRRSGNRSD